MKAGIRGLGVGRFLGGVHVAVALLLAGALPSAEAVNVGFVRAQGGQLVLNGQPFRFVGTNAYYMAIMTALGSPRHADDQIALAQALGFTVMRMWGYADGPNEGMGSSSFQPSPGVYNEQSFRSFDYVLHKADLAGIRLLIPLVDGNSSYGGTGQYVAWCAPGGGERAFYENGNCKQMYKNYVSYVLNRVNTYNGRRYKDDPTVFAWELANEPHIVNGVDRSGQVMRAWVAEMAAFFKSIDPSHMVATGEEGYDNTTTGYSPLSAYNNQAWLFDGNKGLAWQQNTSDPNIDYATIHLYPEFWIIPASAGSTWIADHTRIARSLGKPLVLGEFGASQNTAAAFDQWLDTWEAEGGAGALAWIVMCGVCYGMTDQFGIPYPPGGEVTNRLAAAASRANQTTVTPLGLTLNQAVFASGHLAQITIVAPDPPPAASMDVYFGAVVPPNIGPAAGCPHGDAVIFATAGFTGVQVACLSSDPRAFRPLLQNASGSMLPPSVSFVWTAQLPAGHYIFFVALVRPGAFADGVVEAADVLGVSSADAVFAP